MARVETVTKLQNRPPEKSFSTFDLLKAYQMFQQILSQGLMSEGNTTDLMFRIQDRDNALTSKNSDALAKAMDKLTKDTGTAGTWNTVGTVGGIATLGLFFMAPALLPLGLVAMGIGSLVAAIEGLKMSNDLAKIAKIQAKMGKNQAAMQQGKNSVDFLQSQFKDTLSVRSQLAQLINQVLSTEGQAQRASGSSQYNQGGE